MINSIILYFRLICNIFIRIIVNELEISLVGTKSRKRTIVVFCDKRHQEKDKEKTNNKDKDNDNDNDKRRKRGAHPISSHFMVFSCYIFISECSRSPMILLKLFSATSSSATTSKEASSSSFSENIS